MLNKAAKTLLYALIITSAIGCNNQSEPVTPAPHLTSQEHDILMLKAKRAILELDRVLVDAISTKIDVNRALPDHSSLLAWAVEAQDPSLVNLLLEKGAIAKTGNGNRFSPIVQACRYGNSEIINALLDHGAEPNSVIEDGTSAFQLCAGSALVTDLARMVSLGGKVSAANEYGQTAVMFAANSGNTDNLLYLVDAGASINRQTNEGYSPLFFAIKSHNLNTIQAAISVGADLFAAAQDGTTATQLAVYTANFEFLTWFAGEMDSLMRPEAVNALLTAFDRNGDQLLHAAVNANQASLVAALMKLGANPNSVSEDSQLSWRYEANFKTESYTPPRLTPIEIAEQNDFTQIIAILRNSTEGVSSGS
ncbi:ankyrin repeat domain-containing protein [Alteromonas aestuariivivens]|uniref:Ankyrin repeat domain-containing protein n=2 Tax=Alteromonas aestuariivivens TaxID=1938339 RepID=A0A3D8M6R9_9ALTE|nr:ankyrin repeat domain-containing protein [Alteromonas aestuariivivens]